ncbi:hypothetical protein F4779DRAFT_621221 [Xylariaceae sp. FL0662B]|nr:hypothetical protein F4779DRAFT_621221 [Xylariaceae sp. FL0662B]
MPSGDFDCEVPLETGNCCQINDAAFCDRYVKGGWLPWETKADLNGVTLYCSSMRPCGDEPRKAETPAHIYVMYTVLGVVFLFGIAAVLYEASYRLASCMWNKVPKVRTKTNARRRRRWPSSRRPSRHEPPAVETNDSQAAAMIPTAVPNQYGAMGSSMYGYSGDAVYQAGYLNHEPYSAPSYMPPSYPDVYGVGGNSGNGDPEKGLIH